MTPLVNPAAVVSPLIARTPVAVIVHTSLLLSTIDAFHRIKERGREERGEGRGEEREGRGEDTVEPATTVVPQGLGQLPKGELA